MAKEEPLASSHEDQPMNERMSGRLPRLRCRRPRMGSDLGGNSALKDGSMVRGLDQVPGKR